MASSAHDVPINSSHRRRLSTVEVAGESGKKLIDLSELNERDQALAQFGYKPVYILYLSLNSVFLSRQLLFEMRLSLPMRPHHCNEPGVNHEHIHLVPLTMATSLSYVYFGTTATRRRPITRESSL